MKASELVTSYVLLKIQQDWEIISCTHMEFLHTRKNPTHKIQAKQHCFQQKVVAWRDLFSLSGTGIKNHRNSYNSDNNHKNFCNALHSKKSWVLLLPSLGLYAQCLACSNYSSPYKGQGQHPGCCGSRAPILPPLKWQLSQSFLWKWALLLSRMLAQSGLYDWIWFLFLSSSPMPPPLLFLPRNHYL